MQVVNCTTPANYFHVLRRQLNRDFRKPLIVMTPKSLLRHKKCISTLADMAEGTSFHRVFDEVDAAIKSKNVRRVVICSGKVYYDILEERENRKSNDVKIVRLEQIYPFPAKRMASVLAETPQADVGWCQEEPQNMGSWTFVRDYLEDAMSAAGMTQSRPTYAGRKAAASPATGSARRHATEQAALVDAALDLQKQNIAAEQRY